MNIYLIMLLLIFIVIVCSIMLYLITKPLSQSHELFDGYYSDLLEKTKLFGIVLGIIFLILMVILALSFVLK